MRTQPIRRSALLALLSLSTLALAVGCQGATAAEPKGGPAPLKRLKFRNMGPAVGGRVCRACGVPGDPRTYYLATAGGGVWKSTDGGIHWGAIFDDQPCSTAGSIAVAPSDPNVIYVGTGEANIRGNVEVGNGIYKSTDAGKTWKHVWRQEGQIGTMIVHPTNPDIAYAAVLGHAFGANSNRGVYRTRDGGQTWERVLARDADTGASDVAFDPTNPRILFAGLWQTRRRPWNFTSGGPGSGLYVSRDAGDSWTQLVAKPDKDSPDPDAEPPAGKKYCAGLPEGIWGKVGLAVASGGQRLYALIEADKGGLFRSDDGGKSWKLVNSSRALRERAWYFSTMTVDPKDPDVVWFPQVPLLKSIDGGKTLERVKPVHHGDHHDIWIDPRDPLRIIDSNDGGVDISIDGGKSWQAPALALGQFYHVSADNRLPYHVSGCMQDIGTGQGPSNSLSPQGIPPSAWYPVGGGETGFTTSDPYDPDIVYAGEYGGYLSRYDGHTHQARSVSIYPYDPSGHAPSDLKYRFQWTAPILISPHDHRVVYHAANVLFKTSDAGRTWQAISDDLTRNDKDKQQWSGGPITGDNTGAEVYDTIYSIAESTLHKGLLWAGSDDGLVHVTRDGGKTWDNVTANIKGLPQWGTVRCIEPSGFDADTAYVVIDAHKLDDRSPYLFKTDDGGKTWTSLTAGLRKVPSLKDSYLHVVREDPVRKGLLYLGSEHGLALSFDGGATWQPFKLNFPTVAVTDLVVKDNDLVVATNGRSVWVFDDLTPVRELARAAGKEVHLFPVSPAVRYREQNVIAEKAHPGSGKNPPLGAFVHYYLPHKPRGDITLEVTDARGGPVITLSSKEEPDPNEKAEEADYAADKYKKTVLPAVPGLHRVVWDLRYQGAQLIGGAKLDGGQPQMGCLVNPGTYTLKLTALGQTQTTKVDVLPDPRSLPASLRAKLRQWRAAGKWADLPGLLRQAGPLPAQADLEEQVKLALEIRDDITRLSGTVEQLRKVLGQLVAHNALLASDAKAGPLVRASREVAAKLDALEAKFHNPKARVMYDILAQKGGAKLYSQLAWLFEMIKEGDGPPTQGLREVYDSQHRLLGEYEGQWQALVKDELAKLNGLARKLELPVVVVPQATPRGGKAIGKTR